MFMCRWMNGDVSFVSARTKEDAMVMLDEWADAEGAEISQIRDFMVDFRLNDEGELELKEFGESCRDSILEKAYPRLLEAISTAPVPPVASSRSEHSGLCVLSGALLCPLYGNRTSQALARICAPARQVRPTSYAGR